MFAALALLSDVWSQQMWVSEDYRKLSGREAGSKTFVVVPAGIIFACVDPPINFPGSIPEGSRKRRAQGRNPFHKRPTPVTV